MPRTDLETQTKSKAAKIVAPEIQRPAKLFHRPALRPGGKKPNNEAAPTGHVAAHRRGFLGSDFGMTRDGSPNQFVYGNTHNIGDLDQGGHGGVFRKTLFHFCDHDERDARFLRELLLCQAMGFPQAS